MDTNSIYEIYGSKSFLKIKRDSLAIGKVLFTFVNTDANKKEIEHIDCYLDISLAGALATDILHGVTKRECEKEKAKGEKYPQSVWKSPLGGVSEEKAAERKLRTDGKAISRIFTLGPGSTQKYLFSATQKPGSTDKKGLIVPDAKAQNEIIVRVPVMDDETLKAMAYELNAAILSYRMVEMYYRSGAEISKRIDIEKKAQAEAIANNRNQKGMKGQNIEQFPSEANGRGRIREREAQRSQANTKNEESADTPKETFFSAKSITDVTEYKNGYLVQAVLDDNRMIIVKFSKDVVGNIPEERWAAFKKRTAAGATKFKFRGKEIPRRDGKILIEYASGF